MGLKVSGQLPEGVPSPPSVSLRAETPEEAPGISKTPRKPPGGCDFLPLSEAVRVTAAARGGQAGKFGREKDGKCESSQGMSPSRAGMERLRCLLNPACAAVSSWGCFSFSRQGRDRRNKGKTLILQILLSSHGRPRVFVPLRGDSGVGHRPGTAPGVAQEEPRSS